MKVLFVSEFFYPFIHGGAEVSTLKLACSLAKERVEVEILTPNYGSLSFEKMEGVKIFRFPFYKHLQIASDSLTNFWYANPIYFLYLLLLIVVQILKSHTEIIHVHSRFSIPSAVVAGKLLGIPVIGTFRDWQILCNYAVCLLEPSSDETCTLWEYFTSDFPQYYKDKVIKKNPLVFIMQVGFAIYGRCQRNLLMVFAKKLTIGVCISKYQQKIYELNGFSDLKVIYNTEQFNKKAVKIQLKNLILFQGRITDGKGVGILLTAFQKVLQKFPQYTLILAGQGNIDKFKNQAKKLGIDCKIEFRGWIARGEMEKLSRQVKLVVLPSLTPEPFGRGALESLSLGIPAIVSSRGGMPEIVEDGITGLVVSPTPETFAKAIIEGIEKNKLFRNNISRSTARLKAKFEKMPIENYLSLYKQLL
ncbi:glycosyltransferase family 4 protein [Candidatus Gottesmanbacteria bacterium]|nr:glycosyltransferase family 4 protein [Candidatus Gottesmanbacteria bacterium]